MWFLGITKCEYFLAFFGSVQKGLSPLFAKSPLWVLGSLHFHPFAFIIDAVQVNILIASSTAATNATKAMLGSASSRLRSVQGSSARLVVVLVDVVVVWSSLSSGQRAWWESLGRGWRRPVRSLCFSYPSPATIKSHCRRVGLRLRAVSKMITF